jgi:FAD:protein FMN transferase
VANLLRRFILVTARQSTRRDFLSGKAVADALADAVVAFDDDTSPAQPSEPITSAASHVLRIARRAMACDFEVLLPAAGPADATRAAVAALDLVDQLEAQLTVFRAESEVSQLNQQAFSGPVAVEQRLFQLLERAKLIHEETAGAYDVATGALTKLWGFYRRSGRLPNDEELAETMKSVGMQYVALDAEEHSVRFLRPGLEINLGSIGKGYALDRAGEVLQSSGLSNFLIHGGNSSILARGSSLPNDDLPESHGWWVGLRNPLRRKLRLGEIRLCNRALGTSGSGTQFFVHEGRRYGHILDPRNGRPAEGMLSVTVVTESGTDADALATAFYVMGIERAIEYCRQHNDISAVMMAAGIRQGAVDICLCGFDDADIRIYPDQAVSANWIEIRDRKSDAKRNSP